MGFILITHDIGVITQVADRVTVLRGGQITEQGPTTAYTRELLAQTPTVRFADPAA